MEAHLREVMLSAHIYDALTGICLSQDPDLVFCAVSLSLACPAVATHPLRHGLLAWLPQRLTHQLAQISEVTSPITDPLQPFIPPHPFITISSVSSPA
jgi:hypothetical protein